MMRLLLLLLLLVAYTEPIMYGKYISIKEAPHYVSLLDADDYENIRVCGGSIISEYWVITAAHCAHDRNNRIVAGKSIVDAEDSSSIYQIEKIFVHGECVHLAEGPFMNDIALIKLKQPIRFNEYRQPIRIRNNPPRENETIVVVGFGIEGGAKDQPPVLRQTEVTVVNKTTCGFPTEIGGLENVFFCAGNGTTDVCPGDSGGPAVIDGQLAGLVSYGPYCINYEEHIRKPGKYTRVDAFYDWILNITGIVY